MHQSPAVPPHLTCLPALSLTGRLR